MWVSPFPEKASEKKIRALWDVLWRRCQQRRVQRLLGALVRLQERGHPTLPAADWGCGRGPEPLRQLQLVWKERGAHRASEFAEKPTDTEVTSFSGVSNSLGMASAGRQCYVLALWRQVVPSMAMKALSPQCGIAVNYWKGFYYVISIICGSNVERAQVNMLSSLSLHLSHENLQW